MLKDYSMLAIALCVRVVLDAIPILQQISPYFCCLFMEFTEHPRRNAYLVCSIILIANFPSTVNTTETMINPIISLTQKEYETNTLTVLYNLPIIRPYFFSSPESFNIMNYNKIVTHLFLYLYTSKGLYNFLFSYFLISVSASYFIQYEGSKRTVKKLKLKERIGFY